MEHILTAVRENWVLLAAILVVATPLCILLAIRRKVKKLRSRVVDTKAYLRAWLTKDFKEYGADLKLYCSWIESWTDNLLKFLVRTSNESAFRPLDLRAAKALYKQTEDYYRFSKIVDQMLAAIAILKIAQARIQEPGAAPIEAQTAILRICRNALVESIVPDCPATLSEAQATLQKRIDDCRSAIQRIFEIAKRHAVDLELKALTPGSNPRD